MPKASSKKRAKMQAKLPDDFLGRVLAKCPACGETGVIQTLVGSSGDPGEPLRRFTCTHCGKHIERREWPSNDPFMGFEARLKVETRHGSLFAYNEEHLDYLEEYLSAELREEVGQEERAIRNRSVLSRLPAWAKSAKNRDEVLAAIRVARRRGVN